MSPFFAASSPSARLLLVATVTLCVRVPGQARAEAPEWAFFKDPAPEGPAARRLRAALGRAAPALEFEPERAAAAQPPWLARSRVLPLARIEAALAHAREQAATLAEDDALASLSEAARIGEQLGDVEGAAAWNAEIALETGAVAAQAGLPELAEYAFHTALTLDPSRRLLDAEAAPEVLALYTRIAREASLAPFGQLEVQSLAARARVFLDDIDMGLAPARFRASVGRHVLRVEAPGHRVYGSFIDVFEGERPAFVVAPAKSAELEWSERLARAAARADYAAIVHALDEWRSATGQERRAWVLEASQSAARALLVACEARGCTAPQRISVDAPARPAARDGTPLSTSALAAARAWLDLGGTPARSAAHPALWQRWYFWGALAAAAAAGTLLAVEAGSQRAQRFRVVIERADVGQ